jgi:hypothetical protein
MIDGQSVSQSVIMSWYPAPLWDLRPDITSCRNVSVWNLRSCFCGAPSLTRDGCAICSIITQWDESRRIRNHTLLSHLTLPEPGGPVSCTYISQEQGGSVIPLGTGFPYVVSYNSHNYGGGILTDPQPRGRGPRIYILQEQDGPAKVRVKCQSHVTTDGQSISMSWCLLHSALKGFQPNEL